ncbi:hypothetical protein BKA70DRAFT_592681 [Coprinopsis sp. MPI-PUGE-AT-0042]|nr:hypothetical protein BKA70DRAFT_592681 [Coprinopsis sp. MPI-PUGE-AT-0042]
MGKERREDLPETQSQDAFSWAVRSLSPSPSLSAFLLFKRSLWLTLTGYLQTQQYRLSLSLVDTLLTELKRLDDKLIRTEVHLLESRTYRGIGIMPKAKAALTSARTAANSIYGPPLLQSSLGLQSGILHAEDKDYATGYS